MRLETASIDIASRHRHTKSLLCWAGIRVGGVSPSTQRRRSNVTAEPARTARRFVGVTTVSPGCASSTPAFLRTENHTTRVSVVFPTRGQPVTLQPLWKTRGTRLSCTRCDSSKRSTCDCHPQSPRSPVDCGKRPLTQEGPRRSTEGSRGHPSSPAPSRRGRRSRYLPRPSRSTEHCGGLRAPSEVARLDADTRRPSDRRFKRLVVAAPELLALAFRTGCEALNPPSLEHALRSARLCLPSLGSPRVLAHPLDTTPDFR